MENWNLARIRNKETRKMNKLVVTPSCRARRTVRAAAGPVVRVAAQVALAVAAEVGAGQAVVVRVRRRLLELQRGETVLAQVVVVVVLVPAARRTKSFEQLVH